ncbi:hypothetical protein RvY_11170 [Ramazzottius varieornatus]|uniref:Uncharacterized protein n=1 Tax=Ramazzottius varieornatus TaxID=947166 RepID=A0A1D1VFB0_RAMVA|nr:hypothetical protein RvY_11170 [Ramazzottius varieornatus]
MYRSLPFLTVRHIFENASSASRARPDRFFQVAHVFNVINSKRAPLGKTNLSIIVAHIFVLVGRERAPVGNRIKLIRIDFPSDAHFRCYWLDECATWTNDLV